MPLTKLLAHAAPSCFGEPIVNCRKEREDISAKHRVVEVTADEVPHGTKFLVSDFKGRRVYIGMEMV